MAEGHDLIGNPHQKEGVDGLDIAKQGMIGFESTDFEKGAFALGLEAANQGKVLSDYIISRQSPPGVFITATHQENLAAELKTYKMGDGPFYLLYKPYYLCFFEIPGTILNLYQRNEILIDNGKVPKVSVGTIAKKKIEAGVFIEKAIGSMEFRGEALLIPNQPTHVPIGLMSQAYMKRTVEPGQMVTFEDVELPDSMAYNAWLETIAPTSISLK